MTAERLDIVDGPGGWLLSDMRHKPKRYLYSSDALAIALDEAQRMTAAGTDVEVHLCQKRPGNRGDEAKATIGAGPCLSKEMKSEPGRSPMPFLQFCGFLHGGVLTRGSAI